MTNTDTIPDKAYRQRAKDNPVVHYYISSDGRHVTTWKGEIVGRVREAHAIPLPGWSHIHGKTITSFRVLMDDGVMRYGRGSNGLAIALTAYKNQDRFNAR